MDPEKNLNRNDRSLVLSFISTAHPPEEQDVDEFSPRAPPLDGAQSLPLGRRQLRVPHVHDEDEAVTVGFLPNLVLERVVKNENFPLLPLPARHSSSMTAGGGRQAPAADLPGLLGAADPAALWGDDEAQVHPQPAVGGAGVRPHVGARAHDRELDLDTRKQPHRRRTGGGSRPARQQQPTNLSPLAARRLGESLQQRARLWDALTGSCQFLS